MGESIILRCASLVCGKYTTWYNHSFTQRILASLGDKFRALFSGSAILSFFAKEEQTSSMWENSAVFQSIRGAGELLYRLLRGLHDLMTHAASGSRVAKFFSGFMGKRALLAVMCMIIGLMYLFIPSLIMTKAVGILLFVTFVLWNYKVGLYCAIFLMPIIPHRFWNNAFEVAIVFLTVLSYVIQTVRKGQKPDLKDLDFGFILFGIVVTIGFVTSAMPGASAKTFLFFVTAFLLTMLIIAAAKDKRELERILIIILVAAVPVSLYGIWQSITGIEVNLTQIDTNMNAGMPDRIYSTMENSNNFAEYLILVIPIGICLMFNARNLIHRFVIGGLTMLPVICLGLTYSRSSWVGFILGIGLLLVLKNWRLIPLYALIGGIGLLFLPQSILNRLYTIGNMNDTSSSYRLYIWEGAVRMLKDYWVNGVGLGPEPFSRIYSNYRHIKVTNATHAHMLPLEIWLELGIAGLLSFLWMLARIVKKGIRQVFTGGDRYLNNVFIAGIASFAGIMGAGLFEYVWFYPRILFMFWIIMGVMLAAVNILGKDADIRVLS